MIKPLDHWSQWALEAHLARHLAENEVDRFMVRQPLKLAMAAFEPTIWGFSPINGGTWQRVWALQVGPGDIRAHVVVTGNPLAPHRCSLGMGVERSHRGQGVGRQLMQTALDWVRSQPSVDWVDGVALAHNAPVLALDHSVGFYEVGHIPDVARFEGRSVPQLQLVLKVR